jgi:hypothetical protein
VNAGALELNGRQVVLGPEPMTDLLVTRKILVPSAGGFARYMEILSNPTAVPVTATVRVSGYFGYGDTNVVVAPADTQNTYAVTLEGGCCTPAIGDVFSGMNPPTAVSAVQFITGNDFNSYQWQVTIPANATVIFVHFTLQRDHAGSSTATAAAEALRDLTDQNALTGLTPAEKAEIQNFVVPQ